MREHFLPFSPPLIGEEEIAEVADTLRSDWITTGPKVRRFEEEFAAFIGAPAALALNSCTAALHVALAALGIGLGRFDGAQRKDAVITTPMTFCSSVHTIEHVGATPILVDVEPDTLNIDPAKVREKRKGERGAGERGRGGARGKERRRVSLSSSLRVSLSSAGGVGELGSRVHEHRCLRLAQGGLLREGEQWSNIDVDVWHLPRGRNQGTIRRRRR